MALLVWYELHMLIVTENKCLGLRSETNQSERCSCRSSLNVSIQVEAFVFVD